MPNWHPTFKHQFVWSRSVKFNQQTSVFNMKSSFLSSKFIFTLAVTTAFIAISHPCRAESFSANSIDRDTRRCERAVHREALHFLHFHNLENRYKSVVTLSPKSTMMVCRKSDRLSLGLLRDFVGRIQARKTTSSVLRKKVCEQVVDDLVGFARRCLRGSWIEYY